MAGASPRQDRLPYVHGSNTWFAVPREAFHLLRFVSAKKKPPHEAAEVCVVSENSMNVESATTTSRETNQTGQAEQREGAGSRDGRQGNLKIFVERSTGLRHLERNVQRR